MTRPLSERRREMIARAATQRVYLASQIEQLHRPIAFADRVWAIARFLQTRPLLATIPLGLLAFRRPRSLLKWLSGSWLTKAFFRKLLFG